MCFIWFHLAYPVVTWTQIKVRICGIDLLLDRALLTTTHIRIKTRSAPLPATLGERFMPHWLDGSQFRRSDGPLSRLGNGDPHDADSRHAVSPGCGNRMRPHLAHGRRVMSTICLGTRHPSSKRIRTYRSRQRLLAALLGHCKSMRPMSSLMTRRPRPRGAAHLIDGCEYRSPADRSLAVATWGSPLFVTCAIMRRHFSGLPATL